ncbi:hypothetical protein Nepgr_013113 [Nepenthes gracilis]|uniref:Uncharacterized protein n=1 Tax=Nepenthes gracilis TaxID=150966 RepID=A0AAD3SHI0_NEPGR|nr:hypothetical protein Nepgr_013113 [Nepenthes gracilis]
MVDDPTSGPSLFDIGIAYKQLPLSLFEDPPSCKFRAAGCHFRTMKILGSLDVLWQILEQCSFVADFRTM